MTDDDSDLFRKHMQGVKPLASNNKQPLHRETPPSQKPQKRHSELYIPQYHLSDYISEPVEAASILSYCHPSFQRRQFKALKNGQIPYEGKLDLHGLQIEPARNALCQFINQKMQEQKRCLLLVHGKGGQHGQPPVIKNLVNRWLSQIDDVLAFHSALPKDGGQGAVYVLLRRSLL